jgi:hypothetical protein
MLKRLPPFSDILSVYAVTASMLFAWSIILFIWYLPSWLYFMSFGDLVGVFCYVMASSFIESLFCFIFLLLLSILPPQKYFRDKFAVYGTSIALCVIGIIILRLVLFNFFSVSFPRFWEVLILVPIIVSLLSMTIRPIGLAMMWLSDRLIVFLYILIPLSVFSVLVIIVRNIF